MSERLVREPSRFQLFVYDILNFVIIQLGKFKIWVVSPDGEFIKQYDEDADESVEKLEANCGWAAQITCRICQQRHILFKVGDHYEIAAVRPEYGPEDDGVGEQKIEEEVDAESDRAIALG